MITLGFHWLLTYLFHSSVLLACAALLDWRRRLTSRGLSSTLWRIALFGGFVSAALQPWLQGIFTDVRPGAALVSPAMVSADSFTAWALPPLPADAIDLALLIVPVWIAIAGIRIAGLFVHWVRVTRQTRRLPVASSSNLERMARGLANLARITVPELRIGANIHAPFVAPGRIICIPSWMLERYEPSRLTAALAHEMAHLRRHDNAWRIAGRIASIAGWLQPLNRLASMRLEETAELACDAWAATATGLRRELACTLEDCALRIGASRQDFALTTGMAASGFTVLERVTLLLEDSQVNTTIRHVARWSSIALLSIALVGTLIVVTTLDDDVPPRWLATNGLYQSLRNLDRDVHRSRSVVVKSPGQYIFVNVTENFSIDERESAPAQAGMAVISETRGGVTRSVRYERGARSELRRTYTVNGHVQAMDAEAARWLEALMPVAAPAFSRS